MAIRITGMYSGLDTESIISELASAQSVKKNKLVKAQTKLSWKQDAWKALNTKIFSFYTNVLGNMRRFLYEEGDQGVQYECSQCCNVGGCTEQCADDDCG